MRDEYYLLFERTKTKKNSHSEFINSLFYRKFLFEIQYFIVILIRENAIFRKCLILMDMLCLGEDKTTQKYNLLNIG